MTATTYTPQPGTIAARAMAIINLLPEGQSIPNAVLAVQLEQTSNVVLASMKAAERHGVARRCSEGGYAVRWMKGDGTPPAAVYGDPDEADDAPPVHRVVKAQPGDITLPAAMLGQLGAPPPVSGDFEEADHTPTEPPPEQGRRPAGVGKAPARHAVVGRATADPARGGRGHPALARGDRAPGRVP